MLKVAANPDVPTARERTDLGRGVRSFHLRHVRADDPEAKVGRPVHVLYYRMVGPGMVQIIRVRHERMEPSRYIGGDPQD